MINYAVTLQHAHFVSIFLWQDYKRSDIPQEKNTDCQYYIF